MFKKFLLCAVFLLGPMAVAPAGPLDDARPVMPAPAPTPGTFLLLLAGVLTIGAGRYVAPRQVTFF
jgi:hypothetical protein